MSVAAAAGYRLLDSGEQGKLERFGALTLIRPCAQAVWPRRAGAPWRDADSTFVRDASGTGTWRDARRLPEQWEMEHAGFVWRLHRNEHGNTGIFPEQEDCWRWLAAQAKAAASGAEVLNLFAYTGGSTLACAAAGARVCHVDASKTSVKQARDNAELSGLAARPVRWIVEDAPLFAAREVR
ncbi:MAG: class I SAM-dependent methyltransferase, partial [Planctomycetes bacterium]|nr:class I SAM-dependent methyltransferase [Planctomycetota bacterium]